MSPFFCSVNIVLIWYRKIFDMRQFFTLLLLTAATMLNAQVVYVSSAIGDDDFDGLSATVSGNSGPKRTINAAVEALNEGEILSVAAGNYEEYAVFNKNLQLVKTGAGTASISGVTFSNGAQLTGNKPTAEAFAAEQVTVQSGSLPSDGYLLTAPNAALYINAGTYTDNLFASKSFMLYPVGDVTISNLRMNGNGAVVTLGGPLRISGSLEVNQFNGGFLELSAFDLTLLSGASLSTGSAGSYVRTSGTGRLVYTGLSNNPVVVPVGTATTYAPVTIDDENNTSDAIRVRVREALNTNSFNPDLPGGVNAFVGLEWTLEESTAGGHNASVRFDYTGLNELGNWNDAQNRVVAFNNGTEWTNGSNITIGEAFSTASFTQLGGVFAIYSDFPNSIGDASANGFNVFPNPFNEVLNVRNAMNGNVQVVLSDISGRVVYSANHSGDFQISGAQLSSGMYLLTLNNGSEMVQRKLIK